MLPKERQQVLNDVESLPLSSCLESLTRLFGMNVC